MSTGVRGIIRDMIKNKMFECIITTCGALDHDIARTYNRYYAGDFRMDDFTLLKKKIHRLGNVLVPVNNYGPLIEEKVQVCLKICMPRRAVVKSQFMKSLIASEDA